MQTINLDISCSMDAPQPLLHTKQGDVGRKFKAVITEDGKAYQIPEETVVSLWYAGTSGAGNYAFVGEKPAATVSGNTITVELIPQMLTAPGGGTLCLILTKKTGEQLGLWNILYWVEDVPGANNETAQNYFQALSLITAQALEAAKKLTVPVPVAHGGTGATNSTEALKNLGTAPAIESEEIPGGYYRMANGEKEWINPPLSPSRGVFRTAERYGTHPLYARTFSFEKLPNKSVATIDIGIQSYQVIRMEGWVASPDGYKYPLPMMSSENAHIYMLVNGKGRIVFRTMADYSDWTATVTVWYIRS